MTSVFISYKTSLVRGELNDQLAAGLHDYLVSQKYKVFLDQRELHAGIYWANEIYTNISKSDVLLVMITRDAASPWVQREIDYARGCRVMILPVVMQAADLDRDAATGLKIVDKVMKDLAIDDLEFAQALSNNTDLTARYTQVVKSIERLAPKTREKQNEWISTLQTTWRDEDRANPMLNPPKPPKPRYASYALILPDLHPHPCRIHLGAGDMAKMSGLSVNREKIEIDVLVNPENVYMQMQRVFAPPSVSKTIRLAGAKGRGKTIEQDTIQQELDSEVFGKNGGVPVEVGDVFVTSAGSKDSQLQQQGIDYILHVAVLDANPINGEIKLDDEKALVVKECALNCLKKLETLPMAVNSIIFPLLAAGNGGLKVSSSAEALLDAFKEYLLANPDTSLQHIYLAAFTQGDAETIKEFMDQQIEFRRI